MKEEIIAGIRNALDRGFSISQAVQSFINAGYNPNDVREAAEAFSGASHIAFAQGEEQKETFSSKEVVAVQPLVQNIQPQNIQIQNTPVQVAGSVQKEKGSGKKIIIALVIILAILLGALIFSIIFRDQLLNFVKNL